MFDITQPLLYDLEDGIGDYDRIGNGARFYDDGPKRPNMNRWKNRKQPRNPK